MFSFEELCCTYMGALVPCAALELGNAFVCLHFFNFIIISVTMLNGVISHCYQSVLLPHSYLRIFWPFFFFFCLFVRGNTWFYCSLDALVLKLCPMEKGRLAVQFSSGFW